jgi:hypothetical protein
VGEGKDKLREPRWLGRSWRPKAVVYRQERERAYARGDHRRSRRGIQSVSLHSRQGKMKSELGVSLWASRYWYPFPCILLGEHNLTLPGIAHVCLTYCNAVLGERGRLLWMSSKGAGKLELILEHAHSEVFLSPLTLGCQSNWSSRSYGRS